MISALKSSHQVGTENTAAFGQDGFQDLGQQGFESSYANWAANRASCGRYSQIVGPKGRAGGQRDDALN